MSFIDTNVSPTQGQDPDDPVVEPHTHYVQSDQVPAKTYTASTLPFSEGDVQLLADRIQRQGNFFFGRECRTPDSAKYLARDLLYILDIMYFRMTDIWEPPKATGAVEGSPGYFLPEGTTVEFDYELPTLEAPNDQPWAEGSYVELEDGTPYTWLGGPGTIANPYWGPPWKKSEAKPATRYPAEPTLTGMDQVNADKLAGLGYVADPTMAWASWDYIEIGLYWFTWDGTKWAPQPV